MDSSESEEFSGSEEMDMDEDWTPDESMLSGTDGRAQGEGAARKRGENSTLVLYRREQGEGRSRVNH